MMLSRSSFGRNAAQAFRKQCLQPTVSQRGMASAAPRGFEYETSEAGGIKTACRDLPGPTTTLTVVAKAGSRYQPLPGYSDTLAEFAYKSTSKRSALRITRESELLGGELSAYHSRENLVLTARFLNADLPYYAELLAEVMTNTRFPTHELDEVVLNQVQLAQNQVVSDPTTQALDSVHNVAFHRGLGNPLLPAPSAPLKQYISVDGIEAFAKGAYTKSSAAVVASGATPADLSKWVGQFFKDVPATATASEFSPISEQQSKYHGGEERIPSQAGNAMILAFPGSSSFGTAGYKPEFAVLAALLGGESSIKWTPGSSLLSKAVSNVSGVHVSTKQATYSDAGLFYVSVSGKSAQSVGQASKNVVEALKGVASGNVSSDEIRRATALAKFRALEAGQNLNTGIELTGSGLVHGSAPFQIAQVGQSVEKVTEQQVKEAAKSLLSNKASISTVGDLFFLPYAADIGLTV